ncbi:MAG: Acyl-CoA dehydrogenase, C-terminal domain [Pseudonocardiales bacterium]|nr:Acyl-CoA dehydrogenase, C-terminal domain [Pseudonocardiales bacterium]
MTEEFARIGAMSVLNGFTRAYRDTRMTTIYGGTTEIMKLIIGREIVGRP